MKCIQFFFVLFFSLIFTSCKAGSQTYDYYMQHPTALQVEYKRCANGDNADEAHCQIVNQAAKDFLQLVEDRNRDPEGFGLQIMNLQTSLAKETQTDSVEYKEQLHKLHTMYAVVAATSME